MCLWWRRGCPAAGGAAGEDEAAGEGAAAGAGALTHPEAAHHQGVLTKTESLCEARPLLITLSVSACLCVLFTKMTTVFVFGR